MIEGRTVWRRRLLSRLFPPLLLLLLVALAWLLWREVPPPNPAAGDTSTRRTASPGVYLGPPNSVAVLPFADASDSGDQAALALGFAADLLERLAQLPELRVTARNSSFFFRDPELPRRLVAERLQARYLLSGQWRAADSGLWLGLTLYDAQRDAEAWRDEFSGQQAKWPMLRELAATAVLEQLPLAVPALPPPRAQSFAAWSAWAEGQYLADPLGPADLAGAGAAFERALEIDPGAPRPRLALAQLWLHPGWSRMGMGDPVEQARAAARAVLDESPADPAALALLSYIRHQHDWDWSGAAADGLAAVAAGGDARAAAVAGIAQFSLGAYADAVQHYRSALQRDPLNLGTLLSLGLAQEFAEDYDAALAAYRQLLALHPEYPAARAFRARVKVLQGKADAARREAEQETDPFWRQYAEVLTLTPAGAGAAQPDGEVGALMDGFIDTYGGVAAYQVAELRAWGGDADGAFEWLHRAVTQRDGGIASLLGDPLLRGLHADPRWAVLLESVGLVLDSAG